MAQDYVAPGPRKTSPGAYDQLCNHMLDKQQVEVLWRSLFITWAALVVASFSWQGFGDTLTRLVWPTVPLAILAFLTGVAPLLLAQAVLFKSRKRAYAGLWDQLRAMPWQINSWRALMLYEISAVSFTACFVLACAPSTRISVFKSTKLYPWHLNERFAFFLGCQITLAFTYALNSILKQRWSVRWTMSRTMPPAQIIILRLKNEFTETWKMCLTSTCFSVALYMFSRRWVYGLLLYVARPFVYNFVRSRMWGLSIWTGLQLVMLQAMTVTVWRVTETILRVRLGSPADIAKHAPKPIDCILSGITSRDSDSYYQQFAIHELAGIAQDPKAAPIRKAIFSDLRNPSSASAWSVICRELLVVLGKDYQTLINKGIPPPAPAPAPSQAPQPGIANVPRIPSHLKKAEWAPDRSTTDKVFDGLESVVSTVGAVTPNLSRSISGTFARTPTKAASVAAPAPPMTVALYNSLSNRVASIPVPGKAHLSTVQQWLALNLGELTVTAAERELDMALPNIALDAWAITALAHFTAASFAEDPYGLVQRDIPKILEALLLLRQALDQFKASRDEGPISPLTNALATGLHAILTTFHDRLSAFRFPPHVAALLQKMLEV